MKTINTLALFLIFSNFISANHNFDNLIVSEAVSNNLTKGKLYVNLKYLGETYENDAQKIMAGKYPGNMRYISAIGFEVAPMKTMGYIGDFLLEIGDVEWSDGKNRTNLLFHGGNKPEYSTGCMMLGGVIKDDTGNRHLPEGHTLLKLRKEFYGKNDPNASLNKKITIEIVDIFSFEGKWNFKDDEGIVQLVISKNANSINITYNFIWPNGNIISHSTTNVKEVNSKEITFNLSANGSSKECTIKLSDDKKYLIFSAKGESESIELIKE